MVQHPDGTYAWFTFAGYSVNSALNEALTHMGILSEAADEYCITFATGLSQERLDEGVRALRAPAVLHSMTPNEEAERALKFAECVPGRPASN